MLNNTTRCFPRTRMEAFPSEYTSGIEHYKRPRNNFYVVAILYIAGIILLSVLTKVL